MKKINLIMGLMTALMILSIGCITNPPNSSEVTINITTSDAKPVTGAIVTLTNNQIQDSYFTEVATDFSIVFSKVPFGDYSLEVNLEGYHISHIEIATAFDDKGTTWGVKQIKHPKPISSYFSRILKFSISYLLGVACFFISIG